MSHSNFPRRSSSLVLLAMGWLSFCACGAEPVTRPATQPSAGIPGHELRTVDVNDTPRFYLLHLPPAYDPKKPTPVVLAFHGAAMNGGMMVGFSGLSKKADEAGFVVVYPYGTGVGGVFLTFNAWADPRPQGPADDVAYTAKLLDDLATVVNVDTKRVFATGMSNGAMMCYRLAAELSDRIAAIAPVAGTLAIPQCNPKRPVPVMHFHGTADRIVPFNGPDQRTTRFIRMKSVEETIQIWVKLNGCPVEPKITDLPDTAHDGTSIRKQVYGPGTDGAEVVLLAINGAGHTWPGMQPPVGFIGKSTKNIWANELIWEFFSRHPMK
jgi:polyhydroxybutyrate depolymerase